MSCADADFFDDTEKSFPTKFKNADKLIEAGNQYTRDLLASLNSCRRAIEKGNEVSERMEKKLRAEIKHWKSNHANEVRRARILKDRPDLPIERVKAYEQWGKDVKTLYALKNSEAFWRSETAKANAIINECESALKEAERQLVCVYQDSEAIHATRMCSDALRKIKAYRKEGETE